MLNDRAHWNFVAMLRFLGNDWKDDWKNMHPTPSSGTFIKNEINNRGAANGVFNSHHARLDGPDLVVPRGREFYTDRNPEIPEANWNLFVIMETGKVLVMSKNGVVLRVL